MAGAKDYPRRRFPGGLVVMKNRSINHHCNLNNIRNMIRGIGEDAYRDIAEKSCVGVILKLAESEYTFTGRHVQYLLADQLDIKKRYELWVLVGSRPMRFSLHEFEEITQLNCGLVEESSAMEEVADGDLWADMGLAVGVGPTWVDLKRVLQQCRTWSFEKRRMVGLLVVLHVGIHGLHPNSRIPSSSVRLVTDSERFERHPWGRVAFNAIMRSLKIASYYNESYTVHGFVHALLIWALESIPILGEFFAERKDGENVPILRWRPIKKQTKETDEIVKMDKENPLYGEVNSSVRLQLRRVHLYLGSVRLTINRVHHYLSSVRLTISRVRLHLVEFVCT